MASSPIYPARSMTLTKTAPTAPWLNSLPEIPTTTKSTPNCVISSATTSPSAQTAGSSGFRAVVTVERPAYSHRPAHTAASTAPTISSTTESNIASSSHSAMTRISVSVPDLRIRIRPLPLMRANSAGPEMADSYLFPNYYLCKDMLSDL